MPFDLRPQIELPDHINARLAGLPLVRQRRMLENAINAALDAERGGPTFYVNVYHRNGDLYGHVGPITNEDAAQRVAASWRSAGGRRRLALVARVAEGVPLTNVFS